MFALAPVTMITLSQWRSSIGLFTHPRSGRLREKSSIPCTKFQDYTFCARLCAFSIALWALCLTQFCLQTDVLSCFATSSDVVCDCVISQHRSVTGVCRPVSSSLAQPLVLSSSTQDDVTCCSHHSGTVIRMLLVMSGQVERNPGPLTQTDLEQIKGALRLEFDSARQEQRANFDVIQAQLGNVSASISDIRKDMTNMRDRIHSLEGYQRDMKKEINSLHDRIATLEMENERSEQYSRRENAILHGIGEIPGENFASLRSRIISLLTKHVSGKSWSECDFQRLHRLGGNQVVRNKPRPIIVRFSHFQDKLLVLKSRPSLKLEGVGVSGDLTRRQRDQLKNVPEGKRGYFKNGKLVTFDIPTPHPREAHPPNPDPNPRQHTNDPVTTPSLSHNTIPLTQGLLSADQSTVSYPHGAWGGQRGGHGGGRGGAGGDGGFSGPRGGSAVRGGGGGRGGGGCGLDLGSADQLAASSNTPSSRSLNQFPPLNTVNDASMSPV